MAEPTFYSVNVFPTDGVKTWWDFSFAGVNSQENDGTTPYLYPEDVKAVEMYVDAEGNPQIIARAVAIIAPNRAQITGLPIAAGRQVKIFRQTEIRFPLVDYKDRQAVSEADLDLANRQAIFVAQETIDAAQNNMSLDKFDNYDVKGHKIVNLQAGTSARDAVNYEQFSKTVRALDVAMTPIPDAAVRAGKVLTFDSLGNPQVEFPASGSALELEQRLLASSGATLVHALMPYGEASVQEALSNSYVTAQANAALIASLGGVGPVYLEQFGAVGDGVTNDMPALKLAVATGRKVSGKPGKTYALTGNWAMPANVWLQDMALKPTDPDASARRVLFQTGGQSITLINVSVDRAGSGTAGAMGDTAAIYINACATPAVVVNCTATGNNFGDGFIFTDTPVALYRSTCRDMTWGTAATLPQDDDRMQGFLLVRCTGHMVDCVARNLLGRWNAQATPVNYWTRGFALAGCYDFVVRGCISDNVDQGFDYSGGFNNRRITTEGCHAIRCGSWGFKAANTVTECSYTNCVAYQSGLAGFVASAPSSDLGTGVTSDMLTQNISYDNCRSLENGFGSTVVNSRYFGNGMRGGFAILNSGFYPSYPRGIQYSNCMALTKQGGASVYGFRNDVTVVANDQIWNEARGCTSKGSTTEFGNLHQGVIIKRRAASQSIPNNTATAVALDTVTLDRCGAGAGTSSIMRRAGLYHISATALFAGATAGVRQVNILFNGVPIAGGAFSSSGAASATTVGGSVVFPLAQADIGGNIRIEVLQDSGAALNLANAYLSIREFSAGQS